MKDFIEFYDAQDILGTVHFLYNPKTHKIMEKHYFDDMSPAVTKMYEMDEDSLSPQILEAWHNNFGEED